MAFSIAVHAYGNQDNFAPDRRSVPNGKPPPQAARGFNPRSEGEGKGVGSPLGSHRLNQFLSKRFIAQTPSPASTASTPRVPAPTVAVPSASRTLFAQARCLCTPKKPREMCL